VSSRRFIVSLDNRDTQISTAHCSQGRLFAYRGELTVPFVHTSKTQRRVFSVVGPTTRNYLPSHLRALLARDSVYRSGELWGQWETVPYKILFGGEGDPFVPKSFRSIQ